MSAAAPHGGASLTWPKFARVSPKGASGTGDDDGPRLVKFPPRDAAGGVFASLQACSLSGGKIRDLTYNFKSIHVVFGPVWCH